MYRPIAISPEGYPAIIISVSILFFGTTISLDVAIEFQIEFYHSFFSEKSLAQLSGLRIDL